MCDTSSNYIGQIEMGRRIPSFEKIEKIAAALEISSHELFVYESTDKKKEQKLNINDYLSKMPASIKKELTSNLTAVIKKNIEYSLNP
ncbi:MAG: helix-turn-helix domain-containing protein [Treponema sp.]|nr:helix-turn-helix domain-containing protein [Treponema sp.]